MIIQMLPIGGMLSSKVNDFLSNAKNFKETLLLHAVVPMTKLDKSVLKHLAIFL